MAHRVVVVTAGPGTVKAAYDIDLPRPHGSVQEIRFQPRFLELHRRILESLREEVERAYSQTAQATNSEGEHSCAPVHAINNWTRWPPSRPRSARRTPPPTS